jgi:anhydro-N-acetylmuramic acid kinase
MSDLYIGLMSGTSMDGIDAAIVRFGNTGMDLLATRSMPYPARLREQLLAARQDAGLRTAAEVPELDRAVGECFRDAARAVLAAAGVDAARIAAIGSHGQTLRHEPGREDPFTLQIGDPEVIVDGTGITTVADFRTADIALGGQGAPLAPAFHEWLFRRPGRTRVILNIGGIANITLLPGDGAATTGFDTGPGNTLMDAWIRRHKAEPCDSDGAWAASGTVNHDLLARLLADPYFHAPAPKSTGFEYFNLDWLDGMGAAPLDPADAQATLCELTARTIADAVASVAEEVLVCGGGVHNAELMRRLRAALGGIPVQSTAVAGLDPDWVEAAAFAWLAMRTLAGLPGNLPSVTGASRESVLGVVHRAA